ncbi:PYK10-binding protein 1-like [Eucalyptus grandis]|uniref:PYK10-binding protein 1-like n=1 Tax=Eucalyptus grandis TaxID=71139 RepID=UPI00192EF5C0|nr:PYK10-binding protein 1-like [Eucalyptus grandis]
MLFGPFGGDGGDPWDDGRYIDIKRIVVRYSDFIYSIDFDYVNMDGSIRSTTHGQNLGGHIYEVELGYPDEFVTSFSGFFTGIINSLTFRTNKRIWGPIGREKGEYFSLPPEVRKVVGFFGTSGDFLESIGAQVKLYSNKLYPFKSVGLFGSSNASFWDDGNKHTNVRKIIVEFEPSKGPLIQSIAFQSPYIHRIDDPDEYLTSISGYIMGGITSLTFQTNKKTIGPIGGELGRHFSCLATGGQIVGFYGWSGEHLEAIGAHFEPISHLHPIKSIGPFGGLGGCAWDDGKFNGVREIKVMHDNIIHYIMFVYDKSGERVCSVINGGHSGEYMANITKVKLDYPREYLTSISGYKRANGDDDINNAIVQSLTFHTNKGRHGPFGKETGKYFWYPSTGTRIIGFYGRCRETLNSIGVYAEPIPHLYPFQTIGPFGGSGGTEWDDGVHTDVRTFDITVGDVIQSVGITYDNNGSPGVRPPHGGTKEPSFIRLLLDYPKERLVSISGYTNGYGNNPDNIIHSLKIHTTKTTYGPFGSKDARGRLTEFHIPSASGGGRIVGFFWKGGIAS